MSAIRSDMLLITDWTVPPEISLVEAATASASPTPAMPRPYRPAKLSPSVGIAISTEIAEVRTLRTTFPLPGLDEYSPLSAARVCCPTSQMLSNVVWRTR